MDGKKKKIWLGTGIAFGAVALAFGGWGLSFLGGEDEPYADEDFGEWVVTLAPTCEEKGIETRALLSSPEITESREIPALGHEWGEWEEMTAPACMTDGANRRVCGVCHNYDYEPIPALRHDWGEWETTREATCLTAGYDTRVCNRDGTHTDLRVIPALGHDWSDWAVVTAPTCTEVGVERCTCRNDKTHLQQRNTEALGHDWNDPVVTKAPDCTHSGQLTKICRNDSLHTETESISWLGHDWGEWVVTTAPTYFEEGEETRICANDSAHVEKKTLPILMNGELSYSLFNDGSEYAVKLRNRSEVKGTVVIPETYNGLPVTRIASSAFANCPQLYRVVVQGNNLKTIDSNAFARSPMLERVEIESKNLTGIGTGAFNNTNLESFEIPEGVEKIGNYLFRSCTNLKSLSIPASLTNLGTSPFSLVRGCSALETLTVAEGNEVYRSENNCLIERETNTVVLGIRSSVIPFSATAIGKYAFAEVQIESVSIPESVKVIGEYAFVKCDKLTEVELLAVEEILGRAFSECTALTSIEFPASLVKLGGGNDSVGNSLDDNVAWGCTALESITISEDNPVFRVENNCMIKRESNALLFGLKNSVIPEGVTQIGAYAFWHLGIERVVIPASVTRIETNAFAWCEDLVSVTFAGDNIEYLGYYAFRYDTNISELEIPASVVAVKEQLIGSWTEEQKVIVKGFSSEEEADAAWGSDWRIGTKARIIYDAEVDGQLTFALNSNGTAYQVKAFKKNLTGTVTIPETYKGLPVTRIFDSAFMNCNEIDEIVIEGSNLQKIGNNAFYNCVNLLYFEIPESVTVIGSGAFYGWTEEQTVIIKSFASLEEADAAWGSAWREGCNAMGYFGEQEFMPEGVTTIGAFAFRGCAFSRIIIPTTVESVGRAAFYGWTEEQTIIVKGYASEEEADAAWGSAWRESCKATILYEKEESEQ